MLAIDLQFVCLILFFCYIYTIEIQTNWSVAMANVSILDKQLHTFQVEEITEIKRLAETIFEPLVRPFRQHRVVERFDVRKTINTAMRLGHMMPSYVKEKQEHRKSRLVIFMSLSGIDRCSAVSLIPLFGALQQSALDFRLFIYTDSVIQAEITPEGWLANDWKLAWNNVAGPVVFNQIVDMPSDDKEDTLLLIDSFGGGDSKWYYNWTYEDKEECQKEQEKYLALSGRYSWASRIRNQLNGDFRKMMNIAIPEAWQRLVDKNCNERWMETPALQQYMIRWLFHPQFGKIKHANAKIPHCDAYELIAKLKGKYRNLHLLTPNLTEHNSVFNRVKGMNVFDYHHKTNTIRGFAEVLANIVHGNSIFEGPYTKKISYQKVKLGQYNAEDPDDWDEVDNKDNVPGDHTELSPNTEKCFSKCPLAERQYPKLSSIEFSKRIRGTDSIVKEEVDFSELDVNDYLPHNFNSVDYFWQSRVLPDFRIENGDSTYTRNTKAQRILDEIRSNQFVAIGGGLNGLTKQARKPEQDRLSAIIGRIEFEAHNTRMLKQDVVDILELIAPTYYPYMEEVPLQHVVWCTEGQFNQDRMAISCKLNSDRGSKRTTVWHETLHWLEAVCHPVGVFTNQLLARKCASYYEEPLNLNKLISVGLGEKAMPVQDGSTDWITPYAGKWYRRKNKAIPNATEILTAHGEFFSSKEQLVKLMQHDPFMVRFIAFILMGGPVAAMISLENLKRREALAQIDQRDRKAKGYSVRKSGGSGRQKSGGGAYRPKKINGFGL